MASALRDVFRHNSWANQRLLTFLSGLTADQLEATTDAVYGSVVATMHHLVDGEAAYSCFFTGRMPSWFQPESEPATLSQVQGWDREMASFWQGLALDDIEADAWVEATRPDGRVVRLKAGIVLAQTIHHGNVHREQVSHVLTTLRLAAPDLSLYAYAREAGA